MDPRGFGLSQNHKNNLTFLGSSLSACTSSGVGCTCTTTTVTTCTACSRTGSDYSYSETLSPLSATGQVTNATVRTITISGCLNHAFTDYTPNTACKGTLKMTVPALPRYMAATTNSLAGTGGKNIMPTSFLLIQVLNFAAPNSRSRDSVRWRYCLFDGAGRRTAPCMLDKTGGHYLIHYTLRRCTSLEDCRDPSAIAQFPH